MAGDTAVIKKIHTIIFLGRFLNAVESDKLLRTQNKKLQYVVGGGNGIDLNMLIYM